MRNFWKLGILIVSLSLLVGLQALAASPIKITFNTLFHEADAQAMEQIINDFKLSLPRGDGLTIMHSYVYQ